MAMAYYLMLSKLTDKGRATIRDNPERIKEVNKEVEAMGVKVIAQYFLLGPYDFANILEAADNWNVARVALELEARGTVETLTMPALRLEDFVSFVKGPPKHGPRI
jgi:uncharacterized protein with GYD domain